MGFSIQIKLNNKFLLTLTAKILCMRVWLWGCVFLEEDGIQCIQIQLNWFSIIDWCYPYIYINLEELKTCEIWN